MTKGLKLYEVHSLISHLT